MPIQSANPPDIITLDQWKGINQQFRRATIDDQESWWLENLYPIGPGNLRSVWGPGPPIYTAPAGKTILRIFFGYIGFPTQIWQQPPPGRLGWMFLSDGSIDQVDLDTGEVTHVGDNVWQPITGIHGEPWYYADAVVWRPRFFSEQPGQPGGVLFCSPLGLFAWDGTTLTSPGEIAPDWLTSAAESPVPPIPSSLVMPNDTGLLAMEVYQSRLWLAQENVLIWSSPTNAIDFADVDGGGRVGYIGNKLTISYRDLCASAGYLFVYGDSSTDLISNVISVANLAPATGVTTSFNYQNIDPMVGQRFPRQVGKWGRYMTMMNGAGIWIMRGGDAEQIGEKVTNLWLTLDTTEFLPTFATVTMFGFRILLMNGKFVDTFGVKRSLILAWNGLFWTVFSQHYNLTHIGFYEQNSVIDAYGTDGTSLYHLFDHPDPSLEKRLFTKSLKGPIQQDTHLSIKNFKRVFLEFHDNIGGGVGITGHMITRAGGVPTGTQDIGFQLGPGVMYGFEPMATSGMGIECALDLKSLSPDFTIERIHISSEDRTLFGA